MTFKSVDPNREVAALAEELYRVMTLNGLRRDDALRAVDEARAAFCALPVKRALEVSYPETPAGKRRIYRNQYGNWAGYVSGKRFWEFGCAAHAEREAMLWADGASLEAIANGEVM